MEGVIGYTTMFAGNFAPKNWAFCQGQIVNITSNTALFSLLGTVYGGNGTTTFGLPDLRGRRVVGVGQGPGLSPYSLGQVGGATTETLNMTTMPAHIHPVAVVAAMPALGDNATQSTAAGAIYANGPAGAVYATTPNVNMGPMQGTLTMAPVGSNQSFNIESPFTGMNYIICMQGVYPARN